jgi:hypothetical protein
MKTPMSQITCAPKNRIAPFITVMQRDEPMKMLNKPTIAAQAEGVTRITVSVPNPDYERLQRVAESKRVSMSWVVRDAVERYLTADMPLFAKEERSPQ